MNIKSDIKRKYDILSRKFLRHEPIEKIEAYIYKYGILWDTFYNDYLLLFKSEHSIVEYNNLLQEIKEYLKEVKEQEQMCKSFFKNKDYTFQEILEAKRVLTRYLHGSKNINLYIRKFGLEKIWEYETIIEIYDKHLFALYEVKKNDGTYSIDLYSLFKVAELIKTGIQDGDIVRPFDIIDYYEIIGIPLPNMMKFLPNLPDAIKDVITPIFDIKKSDIWPITNYNLELNINATLKEKEEINNYFVFNDIPFLNITYDAAVERCHKGLLNNR